MEVKLFKSTYSYVPVLPNDRDGRTRCPQHSIPVAGRYDRSLQLAINFR
jgi:hypothetical protein